MAIAVDGPQLQLLLKKTTGVNFNTGNQYRGAAGAIDEIDLAPFLGDAGSVRTMKALDEPCGGFSIVFADKNSEVGGDTVYALAEAMDICELRFARVSVGTYGIAPIVMRGYISSIRRKEIISADGTPVRAVIISGQDAGKLWANFSILPEAQMVSNLNTMLGTYNLLAATGITFNIMPVMDFVKTFTERVMNPAVDLMSAFAGRTIPRFDTSEVFIPPEDGYISASILQGFTGGRYWDVLEYVADRPWNELWVRDTEEGPHLVFRPVPYLDTNGATIMPGAEPPDIIERDIGEIVSLDCSRSDYRTANFFWVPPGSSMPDSGSGVNIAAIAAKAGGDGEPLFSINHENSALPLYGLRKMQHETRLLPSNLPNPRAANLNDPDVRDAAVGFTTDWHIKRANQLRLLNWDNSVWETVEMVLKGHETLEIGKQLQWTRGQFRGQGLVSKGYITRCAHTWLPLKSGGGAGWTTTLTIERSDGFLKRDQMAASPYHAEGRRGPYSPGG